MKKIRVISLIALAVTAFISIDLGINFIFSLIPELQDGIGSHSILQGLFGIFGDNGWSTAKFFYAFEKSLWITFAIFIENIVLILFQLSKRKDNVKPKIMSIIRSKGFRTNLF